MSHDMPSKKLRYSLGGIKLLHVRQSIIVTKRFGGSIFLAFKKCSNLSKSNSNK